MAIHNNPNWTILISDELWLLQMVLKLDIKQCVSEETGFSGGIVRSHISWKGERNILYKGMENCFLVDTF